MQHGDTLILILLLGLLAAWAGISFRKWLYEPYADSFQPVRMTDYNEVPEDDDVVELLIGAGFDVVAGNQNPDFDDPESEGRAVQPPVYRLFC